MTPQKKALSDFFCINDYEAKNSLTYHSMQTIIFASLPMRHISLKLSQIAKVAAGHPFRGKIIESSGSDILVVQMKDATDEGISWMSCVQTRLDSKRTPAWLSLGDILVAARGSHNYAILVDESLDGRKALAAPHFFVVTCQQRTVLPEYLLWLLSQGPCQRYFQKEAEGSLTKSIRRQVVENTPIAIPPLEQQRSVIALAKTLKQEQKLANQLIHNGQILMDRLASDVMNRPEFKKGPPLK